MSYRHAGSALGREVFLRDEPDPGDRTSPAGYSIAAVALKNGWKSDELGWLLNELYGALEDWTPFDSNAGARAFVFYGDRAEEASNLCDTLAYAWTKGVEQAYDNIVASSNDAPDLDAFVEAMFTGEISVGDAYADNLQNVIFAALVSDPREDGDLDLIRRVSDSVTSAVRRHRFE